MDMFQGDLEREEISKRFRQRYNEPEPGVSPELAGPEFEAQFPTVLTADVLDQTGLSKRSSFYKELEGKDLTDPEDQVAVGQILNRVRANPNISESTKSGVESIAMQGFGAAAKQQELFGKRRVKGQLPVRPEAMRTGAVEEEVTEEAIPVVEGRIVREEDLKTMGIGPSNKKIREQILGKNLDDPAQAQTVKEVLDEFGSDPNRSPRVAKGVEDFLTGLGFRKAKDEPTGQPVVGATEPGVSVSDKRRSRAAKGVKTPDTGSMANAGETPKPADVGAATAQPALDADALTDEEQSALQDELQTELFDEGKPSVENLPVASDKKVTRKRPIPQDEIDEANTYLKQYVEKAGSVEGALKQIAAEFAFEKKVNRMAKMSYNALSDKHKELVDREIQQQRTLNTAGAMYLSRYN
jgi:hypothetical protein